MKRFFVLILALAFSLSEGHSQETLKPIFLDACKNFEVTGSVNWLALNGNDLTSLELIRDSIQDGVNFITGYMSDGSSFNLQFYPDELIDTLEIPRIRVKYSGGMHSIKMNYTDCSKLLQAEFEESWKNGKIRYKGDFRDGLPLFFQQHNDSGVLLSKDYYQSKKSSLIKSEYFDFNGNLLWSMVYRQNRTKFYDFKGKRVRSRSLKDFFDKIEFRPTLPLYAGGN